MLLVWHSLYLNHFKVFVSIGSIGKVDKDIDIQNIQDGQVFGSRTTERLNKESIHE